jgi:pimeloyl-ACP methyl ester carboxylesterase
LNSVDVGGATLQCLVDGEGPLVLMAHGFPDGPDTFRHQVPALRGFRVVRPWMRGYAPSSTARDGRYDIERLARDLLALGDHFSPRNPYILVGHDWGAIAAYAACALAAPRISRLVTVAVPHLRVAGPRWLAPRQLARSWYMAFFQLRGLAEWRVRRRDFRFLDRLWRTWSPSLPGAPREVKDSLRDAANLSAALGYYRAAVGRNRLLVEKTRVPALYVHGTDDGCVGVELCDGVERAYPAGVRVCRLRGAGHFAHLEQPEAFNRELLGFLSQGAFLSHRPQKVHDR